MPAPEQFIIPTMGEGTSQRGIMKAVAGSSGTQQIKFFVHKIMDGKATEIANAETYKPVEMVSFRNDALSSYTCRIQDMTQEQRIKSGPLYERFMNGKDSTDTQIEDWDMLNENEKIGLIQLGVVTVEQAAAYQDHEVYRLGIDGKNVRDKAIRHVRGKEVSKEQSWSEEMRAMVEENRKIKAEIEAAKDAYYALQAQLAEKHESKGKHKEQAGV